MTDIETVDPPVVEEEPTAEEIEARRVAREVAHAERVAAARAALPTVVLTADAADAARVAFFDAVKEAGKTNSLRQVALAAGVSAEQVRRIITGKAK